MSFPALSRIKPQAPLLVVPFRQFLQVSALRPYFPRNPDTPVSRRAPPPRPGRRTSRGGAPSNVRRRRRGRHRLRSELRRYLIVFEPPTFALDQRKRPWQTPSLRFVLRRSTNFTSPGAIRMPPSVPLDHCHALSCSAPAAKPRPSSFVPCDIVLGLARALARPRRVFDPP